MKNTHLTGDGVILYCVFNFIVLKFVSFKNAILIRNIFLFDLINSLK